MLTRMRNRFFDRVLGERAVNLATVIVALCAVVVTARSLTTRRPAPSNDRGPPTAISNWPGILDSARWMGPRTAKVVILEFSDFECPFCARFASHVLPAVRRRYAADVAVAFRHWPLANHQNAMPAAIAAECAGAQGVFEQFHQIVFAKRDSLGSKSFGAFAKEAGVRDSAEFARCVADQRPKEAIEADVRAAKAVGGRGTPTVVVNGIRYPYPPDSLELFRIIDSVLSRSPRKG